MNASASDQPSWRDDPINKVTITSPDKARYSMADADAPTPYIDDPRYSARSGMSAEEKTFQVDVEHVRDFVFKVDFCLEGVDDLIMDEPEPVGGGVGPNAERLVAAAVGNCLSASLLFCLGKSRVEVSGMKTTVRGVIARNEEGRWRIMELNAELTPEIDDDGRKQLDRCIDIFENFCVASQSIRQGIPINVKVNR